MAKYLFRASLNPEGIAGVLSEGGTARRTVVKNAIESLGGTVESFSSSSATTTSSSFVRCPTMRPLPHSPWRPLRRAAVAVSTSVLVAPEEIDDARKKKSGWRASGSLRHPIAR
jgi:hypothetical protein